MKKVGTDIILDRYYNVRLEQGTKIVELSQCVYSENIKFFF